MHQRKVVDSPYTFLRPEKARVHSTDLVRRDHRLAPLPQEAEQRSKSVPLFIPVPHELTGALTPPSMLVATPIEKPRDTISVAVQADIVVPQPEDGTTRRKKSDISPTPRLQKPARMSIDGDDSLNTSMTEARKTKGSMLLSGSANPEATILRTPTSVSINVTEEFDGDKRHAPMASVSRDEWMAYYKNLNGIPRDAIIDLMAELRAGSDSDNQSTVSGGSASKSSGKSLLDKSASKMGWTAGRKESPIAPYVCNLALRSFQLTAHEEPVCIPVVVNSAMLFIDMSGYSKVSKALEKKGAFALWNAVNGYLVKIIDIVVSNFGGEIIKFAGDAIVVLWYGKNTQKNVRTAAHCACYLQEKCGVHHIEETDLSLKLHIGLVCGTVTSTVFRSSTVRNMQPHFHMISGDPVVAVGEVVDAAKPGEVCATKQALSHCCRGTEVTPIPGRKGLLRLDAMPHDCDCFCMQRLRNPDEDASDVESLSDLEEEEWEEDADHRLENTEKFLHPFVRRQLKQGLLQSQMAEMRLLTVLFIHKTDPTIDIADWFVELQRVIDTYHCPIVQMIDDDKGVHIIAAINLFTSDREPAVTGIRLAKELVARQAGCTIGIATGMTLCGVVGSHLASRWDITGWACVRACRLMQHGVKVGEMVVIGESTLQYAADESLTIPLGPIMVKGSKELVQIYKLNDVETGILSSITSATKFSRQVHVDQYDIIVKAVINSRSQRHVTLLHGCAGSGKGYLAVRSVFETAIVPFVHVATENHQPLDIVRTIANWFEYHADPDVRSKATAIKEALLKEHNIRSASLALELVTLTVAKKLQTALIVRQCQCLDQMSMSFLRQCAEEWTEGEGRWLVFLTLVPQNGMPSWHSIQHMFRNAPNITTVATEALEESEATALIEHRIGWKVDSEINMALLEVSGKLPGCVDQLISYLLGKNSTIEITVTRDGVIRAPSDQLMKLRDLKWTSISPGICARSSQLLDALGTSARTVLKVVASLHTHFMPVTKSLAIAVTNRILTSASRASVERDLATLVDLNLIREEYGTAMTPHQATLEVEFEDDDDDEEAAYTFPHPSVLDVIRSLTLGQQLRQVSQIAASLSEATAADESVVHPAGFYFATAHYHFAGGNFMKYKALVAKGWGVLRETRNDATWAKSTRSVMRALLLDLYQKEQDPSDWDIPVAAEVLQSTYRPMPKALLECKFFIPPLSLGALTLSLRRTALMLCRLAVDAATDTNTVPDEEVEGLKQLVGTYCSHCQQIDRISGFQPIVEDERKLFEKWLQRGLQFEQYAKFATEYLEYIEAIVRRRVTKIHEHIRSVMTVPVLPEGSAFWSGHQRAALETALGNTLRKWDVDEIAAVRDGLMELATQGWIPKNPDQTVEFQRDCYLRKRTQPAFSLLSLLYVNLSITVK